MTVEHQGSCHCGAIRFHFRAPPVTRGLRCNCSLCKRRSATMSNFVVAKADLHVLNPENLMATYTFASHVAQHHFCQRCGVYPFHETLRKPGYFRINLGCLDGIEPSALPFDLFDGAALNTTPQA